MKIFTFPCHFCFVRFLPRLFYWVLVLIVSFLSSFSLYSQGIGIGEWRDHLPYGKCISVTEAGNRIYCATPLNVFYYDKTDNNIGRLTKVNGLSDVGVTSVSYSKSFQTLVITYKNANLDILQNGSIINIPDIKRKAILGKKTINKAVVYDRYAYLCCGFGIVVLDLMKDEIKDSWFIGPDGVAIEVYDLTTDGAKYYAATESGIYYADVNSPNLTNYASWTKDMTMIHPNLNYNIVEYFHGKIYANYSSVLFSSDTMFVYNGIQWKYLDKQKTDNCYNVHAFGNRVAFVYSGSVDTKDTLLNTINLIWTYSMHDTSYFPQPEDAIFDKDGVIWIADGARGLIRNEHTWSFTQYEPDGPYNELVYSLAQQGDQLYAVPGGISTVWGNLWTLGGLYSFSDEKWYSLSHLNYPAIMDSLRDFVSLAIDPLDPKHVYAGTWGYGVCEFSNNKLLNLWDGSNSSLKPAPGFPTYEVKVGGMCFDKDNNLWLTNSTAANILSVRKFPSGAWKSFNLGALTLGASGVDVSNIIIDNFNQKWMLLRGNRILVFDDNYTIDDGTDDHAKILDGNLRNGNLPGYMMLSIAMDLDGLIWVGTDAGVVVFYTPENIFTNQDFDAQRIYVQQDGYTQYLLETEAVTCIAIDGANQKWFGTDKAGVFCMSKDGTQQIYHFTAENSPLLSNTITSIVINGQTGEVFFGTDKGIISFKGTATTGGEKNEGVYAYPNPVKRGYEGPIAVKGLVKDAEVKIADISGSLVYRTKAQGGQAIWNGCNFSGKRVQSGVYLVFVSNDDGSETTVTKILIQN